MADARDKACWTNHAAEQMQQTAYKPSAGAVLGLGDPLIVALNDAEPWEYVLDFGCGTGLWRGMFKDRAMYVGVDQNPDMIAGALQRWPDAVYADVAGVWPLCNFIQVEGVNDDRPMPFVAGAFDIVFTSAVLQHNIYVDQEKIVREFNRVLKIGGRYIGFENTYGPLNPGTPDNYTRTREGWRELFEDRGFETVYQSDAQHPVQVFQKVRDL